MKKDLLVVGAQPGSLGSAVAAEARKAGMEVWTAGIGGEACAMDARAVYEVRSAMLNLNPRHVVCTIGQNIPVAVTDDELGWKLQNSLEINVMAVLRVLSEWVRRRRHEDDEPELEQHFVAISSNSAHIARTGSVAYCASKAALSMAIRCAAREGAGSNRIIYCYEPGLLDTRMTVQTDKVWPDKPLHRIPGMASRYGFDASRLATLIVDNIMHGGALLNGACIRLDGGEQ